MKIHADIEIILQTIRNVSLFKHNCNDVQISEQDVQYFLEFLL